MTVVEIEEPEERSHVCERVLRDLPEWFGIEEATAAYIRDVADLPTCAEYLQVKTLGPSDPDLGYARTRSFYLARGFVPLEELHGLWEHNPCLLMVKRL